MLYQSFYSHHDQKLPLRYSDIKAPFWVAITKKGKHFGMA